MFRSSSESRWPLRLCAAARGRGRLGPSQRRPPPFSLFAALCVVPPALAPPAAAQQQVPTQATLVLSRAAIDESGTNNSATVKIRLDHPVDESIGDHVVVVAVRVTVSPGEGATAADYRVSDNRILTVAHGATESAGAVTITAVDNAVDGPDKSIAVSASDLSQPSLTVPATPAVLTLRDDEAPPTVTLEVAAPRISENGGATTVAAALSHPSSAATTVTVRPVSGVYTVGADATIAIPAGETSNPSDTAAIAAVDNDRDEADRRVTVTASASNAQGVGTVTGAPLTLTDDDAPPERAVDPPGEDGDEPEDDPEPQDAPNLIPSFGDASTPAQRYVVGAGIDLLTLPEATGGDGALSYALAPGPPAGLTFDPGRRILSGVPERAMDAASFTLTATDRDGDTARLVFTVEVVAAEDAACRRCGLVRATVLSEVARAWKSMMTGAVARRMARPGAAPEEAPLADSLASVAGALRNSERALAEGARPWRALADAASLAARLGDGGETVLWAEGDFRRLSGRDDAVSWSGDAAGAFLGVETRLGTEFRAGVAGSRFEADFDYADRGARTETAGAYESRITGVHPWLGWRTTNRGRLWAVLDYGSGDIVETGGADSRSADATLIGVAAGGGRVFRDGEAQLDLRGDLQAARMSVAGREDAFRDLDVRGQRLRVAAEAARPFRLGAERGAVLTPALEVGLRVDGGDGATGAGALVGGGLDYADPLSRLRVETHGRALLAHEGGAEEWEIGGALEFAPGPGGRGLSFGLHPSLGDLGENALSGARLRERDGLHPQSNRRARARLDAALAWGLEAFSGRGAVSPWGGLTLAQGGERGWRLGLRVESGPGFAFALETAAREAGGNVTDYGAYATFRITR